MVNVEQGLLLGCLFLLVMFAGGRSLGVVIALVLGLAIRLVLGWLEQGGYLSLPWSGSDSEEFYAKALDYSRASLSTHLLDFEPQRSYVYSWCLGWFMRLFGTEYFYLRVLNMMVGCITAVIVQRALLHSGASKRCALYGLCVYLFFPFTIILNSVLLRESIISFCVALATLGIVRFQFKGQVSGLVLAVVASLIGALFHGAVAVLMIMLLLMVAFVPMKGVRAPFSSGRGRIAIGLVAVAFLGFVLGTMEFGKIGSAATALDQVEGRFERVAKVGSKGESGYPEWLTSTIDNPIYWIPRFVYFAAAPFPWDWRNAADAAAGLVGLGYLALLFWGWRIRKVHPGYFYLFVLLVVCWFVYSIGTDNVGSSIRHRTKFFPLLLVVGMAGWEARRLARYGRS
jgi:hypothetical protein